MVRIDEEKFIPINPNNTLGIGTLSINNKTTKEKTIKINTSLLKEAVELIDRWGIEKTIITFVNEQTPLLLGKKELGVLIAPIVEEDE